MERAPQRADRRGARRPRRAAWPCSPASASRARPASADRVESVARRRPPRTAAARAWPPARRRPRRRGSGRGRPRPAARRRRRSAKTSTAALCADAERAQPHRQLVARTSRPVSASASTSPASRRSVSRIARWRISSSATTVTACWRISRSKSPRPPASRAATSQACGAPRPRGEHRQHQRAAGDAPGGRARTRAPSAPAAVASARRAGAPRRAPARAPRSGSCAPERACEAIVSPAAREHAHGAAGRGGERAHHLVEPALLEHQPLEPLVDRDAALEHLVLLVHEPRERLLGDRDERQLVGHLEHREAELVAPPSTQRRRAASRGRSPVPKPSPARWWPASSRTNSRWRSSRVELDAGRQQQLAARQPRRRVGQLRDVHPAHRRVRAVLARRELEPHLGRRGPRTVSIAAQWRTIRSQASVSTWRRTRSIISNSSRVRDQRRRELDDGVAAVVRAADQPVLEELARHEAAQQLLATPRR